MSDSSDPLPQDIREAIERGNLIDAIKLVREQTGLGLKEAKDLVDSQARENVTRPVRPWSGTLPATAAAALQQGNKIEAIRLLREETGVGLKDARQFIDADSQQIHADPGLPSPGEVPRSRTASLWFVASVIVVGIVLYFVFRRAT